MQTHYHVAVDKGFNSDVEECLPLYLAAQVRFLAGTGKLFSLYDKHIMCAFKILLFYENINFQPQGSRSVLYTYPYYIVVPNTCN